MISVRQFVAHLLSLYIALEMARVGDVCVKVMQNGLKIPVIGLGTWEATNEAELEAALDVALECGYRHIDTAYVYGSEETIGRVLKKWFSSGKLKREDIFITTKLPMYGFHEDKVEVYMERSLKNLDLEYVDLYLIHFPVGTNLPGEDETNPFGAIVEEANHIEIWKKMEKQVDAGKTKSIGLSNFNEKQIEKIWNNCRIKPACLQVEIHLYLQQSNLVDYCHEKKINVVAYSPLGSPGYNKFLLTIGKEEKPLPNILSNKIVKAIAEKHKKSSGQVALRYLIEKNIIPIPKSVTPSRIKENFEVLGFHLDAGDLKELEKLDVGESARIFDFKLFPMITDHPKYPFPK